MNQFWKYFLLFLSSSQNLFLICIVIDRALRPGPGSGRASNVRPKPGSGRTSQKPGPGPGLLDFKFSRCFFEMCTRHARRAEQPIASVQYFKREANSSTFFSGFALPKKSKQNKKNIGKFFVLLIKVRPGARPDRPAGPGPWVPGRSLVETCKCSVSALQVWYTLKFAHLDIRNFASAYFNCRYYIIPQ